MNILFLLGNGFDVNLGLGTKYTDFYEHYKKDEPADTDQIKKLKAEIDLKSESWADLEIALGEYTEIFSNHEEFEPVILHLTRALANYLDRIESEVSLTGYSSEKIIENMINPEAFLSPRESNELASWAAESFRSVTSKMPIDILTFNYTKTMEVILGKDKLGVDVGKKLSRSVVIRSIEHIHGYTRDRMVLGVNDIEQILNIEFRKNIDLTELFVKPQHNSGLGHMRDDHCMSLISSANLICIFGSSIGPTDKIWWEKIAFRLIVPGCRLIIFHYTDSVVEDYPIFGNRIKRKVKNDFLKYSTLTNEQKNEAEKAIYVGVNTSIFADLNAT